MLGMREELRCQSKFIDAYEESQNIIFSANSLLFDYKMKCNKKKFVNKLLNVIVIVSVVNKEQKIIDRLHFG